MRLPIFKYLALTFVVLALGLQVYDIHQRLEGLGNNGIIPLLVAASLVFGIASMVLQRTIKDPRLSSTVSTDGLGRILVSYLSAYDASKAYIAVDKTGLIQAASPAVRAMTGVEAINRNMNFDALWQFNDNTLPVQLFTNKPLASYHLSRGQNDHQQNFDITVLPVESDYLVVVNDVTNRKELDELQQEFIAVTSHELRTPLTIAEGNLSLLMSDATKADLDVKLVHRIDNAVNSVHHLGEIINDLTTIRSAEAGLLDVDLSQVSPTDIIAQIIDQHTSDAVAKGIALTSDVEQAIGTVLTSSFRVVEILQNYTVNAIKFTMQGSVVISARAGHNGSVIFAVSDTGIGISNTDQQKLFARFQQVENFRTRTVGGTGIGLYIVNQIARRLDAKVWCESSLGTGSKFYLEVPQYSRLGQDIQKVNSAAIDDIAANV